MKEYYNRLFRIKQQNYKENIDIEFIIKKQKVDIHLDSNYFPLIISSSLIESDITLKLKNKKKIYKAEKLVGVHSFSDVTIEITYCGECTTYKTVPQIIAPKKILEEEFKKHINSLPSFKRLIYYLFYQNGKVDNTIVYVKKLDTGEIIKEKIYNSMWLTTKFIFNEFLSESVIYNKILEYMTKKISPYFDRPISAKKINSFIKYFDINTDELEKNIDEYKTFNEFFYRRLKNGSRWVEKKDSISSPADCRILGYTSEKEAKNVWIKSKKFSLEKLINKKIDDPTIIICRLSPEDYHRFHSPFDCTIEDIKYIKGKYLTVQPKAFAVSNVLNDNLKVIMTLKSEKYGLVYFIPIGATMVGSIVINHKKGEKLKAMDEIGYFKFGGSCIIMIFSKSINIRNSIYIDSMVGIETLVKVGNTIAS